MLTRYIILTFLFFVAFACNEQSGKYTFNKKADSIFTEIKKRKNYTFIEFHISPYVDSLNNARNEDELPYFIADSQFDYKHKGVWDSPRDPVSVRAQIVNRINNCKVLHLIIKSSRAGIKSKPEKEDNFDLPFAQYSFFDLVQKRYDQLECY